MKKQKNMELTKVEKREIACAEYIEKQMEMFDIINKRAIAAGRKPIYPDIGNAVIYNIIKRNPDGTFSVRKRETPFTNFGADGEQFNSGSFGNRSFSDRVMGRDSHYTNDETKLLLSGQLVMGVEVGETESMGCACV